MEDRPVACPLVPTVPHRVSGSCASHRRRVPRGLQPPSRGDALTLPCPSALRTPGQETFTPTHDRMHGTHAEDKPPKYARPAQSVDFGFNTTPEQPRPAGHIPVGFIRSLAGYDRE